MSGGKGLFRMDFATGEGSGKLNHGWWAKEEIVAPAQPAIKNFDTIPAGLTKEYHVLAEVCGSMSNGFMLLNQRERVAYSNQSALRLLRIKTKDMSLLQDFNVRDHLLAIAAHPQQVRLDLDRIWQSSEEEYYTDLALADAAVRWLRMHVFPVRDDLGRLLGRGLLFDDITLERSVIESRSEALALAAHELKTPLAIIKGCATTLLGSSARWDAAMQHEMLQMIDMQSDRLYDILNTLLDVWRLDAGTQPLRLAQVHLPELLQQLVVRWQRQASGHRFVLSMPSHMPMVVCDAIRVEQVLNHLLNNAVMYSHSGRTIEIQLATNDIEVCISIADEGIGIAPEHIDRIFDRFYRIQQQENHPGGSGLGLASARSTVEAHGGRIWVDSPGLGQGATFYFTLPFTAHSSAPTQVQTIDVLSNKARSETRTPLFKQDRRVRVLLGESDARLMRYLRANLEEGQYRVQAVSHGVQFLRQLDLEEPDIILLSTRLSDMSGLELLQRLREFSQTPVIMLSDDCDEDERVQLFDLGGDDLVIKPFSMKELMARVRALLRRRSSATEQTTGQSIFTSGGLVIDYAQHLVTVEGRPIQLSRTEYKLLSLLAQHVGMVVTHELLLEKVWGPEYNRDIDFIWVYISRLRRKVEADSRHPKYILTIPDVGYKLAKL
ncbi:MAG TPA: ATP-binding protein [Ktedonobacteraceae bacterium]|nr:ATP-binding protein [Ktedonobacteraceae bacterium]